MIGNHLAQRRELSLLAIGLAVHIQSLPTGARVDIKTLARKFPEGPDHIAAALRELEAHGYLRRPRERTSSGHIVTRTVSCDQPGRRTEGHADSGTGAEPERGQSATGPGVAARLERDVSAGAVRHALTRDLHPRDCAARPPSWPTTQLPPPPPFRAPATPPDVRHPLQTCDGCERAFRAPDPGRCRDCRSDLHGGRLA